MCLSKVDSRDSSPSASVRSEGCYNQEVRRPVNDWGEEKSTPYLLTDAPHEDLLGAADLMEDALSDLQDLLCNSSSHAILHLLLKVQGLWKGSSDYHWGNGGGGGGGGGAVITIGEIDKLYIRHTATCNTCRCMNNIYLPYSGFSAGCPRFSDGAAPRTAD